MALLPEALRKKTKKRVVRATSKAYPLFFIGDQVSETQTLLFIIKNLASKHDKVCILTDTCIYKSYKDTFKKLTGAKNLLVLTIPQGERSKSRQQKAIIEDKLLAASFSRKSALVAFGGGMIGDLGGFVAATYMRGILYYQYPTSLLAMVDSSIGGKTGIDVPAGKNLIGAIYQPEAVFIDIRLLKTLPPRELASAAAEIIKVALTFDENLYKYLLKSSEPFFSLDPVTLSYLVRRATELKAMVVEKDETESSLRKCLNFGHTLGHAIESALNYQIKHGEAIALGIKHGEAIALGIYGETLMAATLKFCPADLPEKIHHLLRTYRLPTTRADLSLLKGMREGNQSTAKKTSLAKTSKKTADRSVEKAPPLSPTRLKNDAEDHATPSAAGVNWPPLKVLIALMGKDKKNLGKNPQMTMLKTIGKLHRFSGTYTHDVEPSALKVAYKALKNG